MFYKETHFQELKIGRIPKEWQCVRVIDFADVLKGFAYSSKFFNKEEKGLPLIRIRDLGRDETECYYSGEYDSQYIVQKGDVLVGMDGEFNVTLWTGAKGLLNQRVCKFSSKDSSKLDNSFLYYSLQKPIKKIEAQISQTTVKHLLDRHVNRIFIPFPYLWEQKKIVEVLSCVDLAIQKTDEVIAKTERLKKGLMQKLLTKGIGHKELKDTEIGKIPKTWQVVPLKNFVKSYKNGIYKKSEYYGKGYPSIRMYNIVEGRINKINAPLLDVTKQELEEYGLEQGDIIVNRVNTAELVGKAGIVPNDFGKATFESKNIRVRIDGEKVLPEFLSVFVQTSAYSKQILSRAKIAVAQATITQDDLDSILIPLPQSIEEQRKIPEIVSTVDKKIELEKNEKTRLERIKQGFMDLLLTGKIRVRVD